MAFSFLEARRWRRFCADWWHTNNVSNERRDVVIFLHYHNQKQTYFSYCRLQNDDKLSVRFCIFSNFDEGIKTTATPVLSYFDN